MFNCIFCRIVTKQEPAHIVYEDDETVAFLDKYPQSRGHLQLVPKKHYRWLWQIPDMGNFFSTAQKIIRGIIPALGADHVTMATFGYQVKHAHLWIVPQYRGEIRVKEREDLGTGVGLERVAELLQAALGSKFPSRPTT